MGKLQRKWSRRIRLYITVAINVQSLLTCICSSYQILVVAGSVAWLSTKYGNVGGTWLILQGKSKITHQNFCMYFCLWPNCANENLPSCLPFISSPLYQFWSTYLIIYENCDTFCNINPGILTVCFSLVQYSQTLRKRTHYIIWNHTVKVFVSNCYVIDQILCSKCPP